MPLRLVFYKPGTHELLQEKIMQEYSEVEIREGTVEAKDLRVGDEYRLKDRDKTYLRIDEIWEID